MRRVQSAGDRVQGEVGERETGGVGVWGGVCLYGVLYIIKILQMTQMSQHAHRRLLVTSSLHHSCVTFRHRPQHQKLSKIPANSSAFYVNENILFCGLNYR